MSTNGGLDVNLTSNYLGRGRSKLIVRDVSFDEKRSWLLASVADEASVETTNSAFLPTELYPDGSAHVRIEGHNSQHTVWLRFPKGSSATLEDLPAHTPFSYSFGRGIPTSTGIDYLVEVVDGDATLSLEIHKDSDVLLRGNERPSTIGYFFEDVTVTQEVDGLVMGVQSGTYENGTGTLTLDQADLGPFAWQLYSENANITKDAAQSVIVRNSIVNEVASVTNGKIEVEDSTFEFATIMAAGPGSSVRVRRSIINSQTMNAQFDGELVVEESHVFGTYVQAVNQGRVLLLNNVLGNNVCHADCLPMCLPTEGTTCNPLNGTEMQFAAHDDGIVVAAGIDGFTGPIMKGSMVAVNGDAFIVTAAEGASLPYDVSYIGLPSGLKTPIVTGAIGPVRGALLAQLSTSSLPAGDYAIVLDLYVGPSEVVSVQRPMQIVE
jgi:hypothetical protein